MEFKRRIDLRQSFGHCEDRRDAYAAGEQDASARVARKREQVARLADGEGVALLYSRSEEHTSELQSLMRISYAVFCLKKKNCIRQHINNRLYSNRAVDKTNRIE